eukprot:533614_1
MSDQIKENQHTSTCGLCGASYTAKNTHFKRQNKCEDCRVAGTRLTSRRFHRKLRRYAKDNEINKEDGRKELRLQRENDWNITCSRCPRNLQIGRRYRSVVGDLCKSCYHFLHKKHDWIEKIKFKSDTHGQIIFKNERGKSIQERLFFRAFEDNITFVFGDRDVQIIRSENRKKGVFNPDKLYQMKTRTIGFNKEFD